MRESFRVFGQLVLAATGLLVPGRPARSVASSYPFGSHPVAYASGSIIPSHLSQATLDQAVRDFYDAWKAEYVREECGTGRYVVRAGVSSRNLTVSEAHGYGMMIMALMAGHDPQAKAIFDGMYAYFREHPSTINPGLMAWNQDKRCHDVEGADSASDGDLDIAYALLLAGKQWGNCGLIDYTAEALSVIAAIQQDELDTTAQYVKLGDWVDPANSYYSSTRSSDFMPDHYRSYQDATGNTAWTGLLDRTYTIVSAIQTNHSPSTGLLPDFIVDPLTSPAPAPPNFLEGPLDGAYSYNAARDPWRLGTDYVLSGETRAKSALQAINSWIRSTTGDDPSNIKSSYQLDGSTAPDYDFLSMAFVAPLGVGAMVDASNQAWLNDIWDLVTATPVEAEGYFENTLKLLAMIVMSGNWWAPELVATPSCSPETTPVCTNPGYMTDLRITIGGINREPGKQRLALRGKAFFPQGTPVTAFDGGAQLLVEDLGAGNAVLYDLTTNTTPIPSSAQAGCDPDRDGWKVRGARTTYRNRSTALDPPACTPGSSQGLRSLRYRERTDKDFKFRFVAKTTLTAPVGPLRFSLVLGDTAGASSSGQCAAGVADDCRFRASRVQCTSNP